MDAKIAHLQFGIDMANLGFYKDLANFLEWPVLYEDETFWGVGTGHDQSLWFGKAEANGKNDYDGIGMNHIGISVPSAGDVDKVAGYLQSKSIEALFETPRHRPEFADSEDQTYYQVMFKSPDPILFEVVYTGPK